MPKKKSQSPKKSKSPKARFQPIESGSGNWPNIFGMDSPANSRQKSAKSPKSPKRPKSPLQGFNFNLNSSEKVEYISFEEPLDDLEPLPGEENYAQIRQNENEKRNKDEVIQEYKEVMESMLVYTMQLSHERNKIAKTLKEIESERKIQNSENKKAETNKSKENGSSDENTSIFAKISRALSPTGAMSPPRFSSPKGGLTGLGSLQQVVSFAISAKNILKTIKELRTAKSSKFTETAIVKDDEDDSYAKEKILNAVYKSEYLKKQDHEYFCGHGCGLVLVTLQNKVVHEKECQLRNFNLNKGQVPRSCKFGSSSTTTETRVTLSPVTMRLLNLTSDENASLSPRESLSRARESLSRESPSRGKGRLSQISGKETKSGRATSSDGTNQGSETRPLSITIRVSSPKEPFETNRDSDFSFLDITENAEKAPFKVTINALSQREYMDRKREPDVDGHGGAGRRLQVNVNVPIDSEVAETYATVLGETSPFLIDDRVLQIPEGPPSPKYISRFSTCNLCQKQVVTKHILSHQMSFCPAYKLCECGTPVLKELMEFHVESDCYLTKKICPQGCGRQIGTLELEVHLACLCPMRDMVCICGETVIPDDTEAHQNACAARIVSCKRCFEPVRSGDLDFHLDQVCKKTDESPGIDCKVCYEHIAVYTTIEAAIEEHNAISCSMRPWWCPSCGVSIPMQNKEKHINGKCIDPLKPCINGCGLYTNAALRERHMSKYCRYRIITCICGLEFCSEDLKSHLKNTCPGRPVTCPQCKFPVPKINLETHINEKCMRRFGKCKQLCGHNVYFYRIEGHEKERCPNRPLKCEHCLEIVTHGSLNAHHRSLCQILPCQKCHQLIFRTVMKKHVIESCPMRLVACPECGDACHLAEIKKHRKDECRRRQVACKFCGMEMSSFHLEKHLTKCSHRDIKCKHNCGMIFKQESIQQHQDVDCVMIDWTCACGEKLKMINRRRHLRFCQTYKKCWDMLFANLLEMNLLDLKKQLGEVFMERNVPIEVVFCALAESRGDVKCAKRRLKNLKYLAEMEFVADTNKLSQYVTAIPLYEKDDTKAASENPENCKSIVTTGTTTGTASSNSSAEQDRVETAAAPSISPQSTATTGLFATLIIGSVTTPKTQHGDTEDSLISKDSSQSQRTFGLVTKMKRAMTKLFNFTPKIHHTETGEHIPKPTIASSSSMGMGSIHKAEEISFDLKSEKPNEIIQADNKQDVTQDIRMMPPEPSNE